MSAFERAFLVLIGHEGGYVNDPDDPGGETKYGISKRAYPTEDIAAITLERAQYLYRHDFWDRIRGDELPYAVALPLFDFAVNSGVHEAVLALQRAVGAITDGIIGPKTIETVARRSAKATVIDLQAERLVLVARLKTFPKYGRGWSRRVVSIAVEALTE